MMKPYLLLIVAALGLVLAGCTTPSNPGGTDTPGTPTNPDNPDDPNDPDNPDPPPSQSNYSKLGFVTVIDDRTENSVTVLGGFYSYDEAFPNSFADNPFFVPGAGSDECTVTRDSGLESSPPVSPGENYTPVSISAGDEISIDTSSTNYLRLPKQVFEDFISYTAERSGALPAGLTVTIPGDVFPGFTNLSLNAPASFNLIKPATPIAAPITADSAFEWTTAASDGFVSLSASRFDTETNEFLSVSCVLEDDGAFSFSAATKAELGADFSSDFFSIGRTNFTTLKKGDAVLVLPVSSSVSRSDAVTITP